MSTRMDELKESNYVYHLLVDEPAIRITMRLLLG